MGRIRLFPLLFQNGCSQCSRFPTAGQGERSLDCKQMCRSEFEGFTVTISPCLAKKKTILEAPVYLLGCEEIDEEEFLAIYEIASSHAV